jgi:hypothetical protein
VRDGDTVLVDVDPDGTALTLVPAEALVDD